MEWWVSSAVKPNCHGMFSQGWAVSWIAFFLATNITLFQTLINPLITVSKHHTSDFSTVTLILFNSVPQTNTLASALSSISLFLKQLFSYFPTSHLFLRARAVPNQTFCHTNQIAHMHYLKTAVNDTKALLDQCVTGPALHPSHPLKQDFWPLHTLRLFFSVKRQNLGTRHPNF